MFAWTSHFWKSPLLSDLSWAYGWGPRFWASGSVASGQDVLARQLRGIVPSPQPTVGSNWVTLILIQTFADSSPLIYPTGPQIFLESAPLISESLQGMFCEVLRHLSADFMWPYVDITRCPVGLHPQHRCLYPPPTPPPLTSVPNTAFPRCFSGR